MVKEEEARKRNRNLLYRNKERKKEWKKKGKWKIIGIFKEKEWKKKRKWKIIGLFKEKEWERKRKWKWK